MIAKYFELVFYFREHHLAIFLIFNIHSLVIAYYTPQISVPTIPILQAHLNDPHSLNVNCLPLKLRGGKRI